jgi:hypothetical protein
MGSQVTCLHCGASLAEGTRTCTNCGREPLITGEADAVLRRMASPAGLKAIRKQARGMRRAGASKRILLELERAQPDGAKPTSWRQRRRYERHARRYRAIIGQAWRPTRR